MYVPKHLRYSSLNHVADTMKSRKATPPEFLSYGKLRPWRTLPDQSKHHKQICMTKARSREESDLGGTRVRIAAWRRTGPRRRRAPDPGRWSTPRPRPPPPATAAATSPDPSARPPLRLLIISSSPRRRSWGWEDRELSSHGREDGRGEERETRRCIRTEWKEGGRRQMIVVIERARKMDDDYWTLVYLTKCFCFCWQVGL